ncbi:MAG TPA: TIGR02206 family membrane protein [Nocardioides sp.]|nr:TIGR02206 family membrane protein [Nocardioides sp.]
MGGASYVVTAAGRLQLFGVEHWAILTVFTAVAVATFRLGRRPAPASRRIEVLAGTVLAATCAPFEAIDWTHGPQLQLCDFAWIASAGALLTGRPSWSAPAYFWGLTLSVQGVLTPDLSHGFPSLEFWGFVVRHLAPVWVGIYLVAARRGPSWRALALTVLLTSAWAAAVMAINSTRGTNYGYLNGKPPTHSLLDLLGPWPLYVVLEIALIVALWTLMTWPWNRADSRNAPDQ